jgi:hypothetical protein
MSGNVGCKYPGDGASSTYITTRVNLFYCSLNGVSPQLFHICYSLLSNLEFLWIVALE